MASYRLSRAADAEIAAIYEYSILSFGEATADEYFIGLHSALQELVTFPMIGRDCSEIRPGCRRFGYRQHVIFYVIDAEGVLVLDILGRSQDPVRHLNAWR